LNVRIGPMGKLSAAEALQLSIPERIQLVEDIWDSIASVPEQIALTAAQRDELDRRLDDYRQHHEEGSPWEEVRKRILNRGQGFLGSSSDPRRRPTCPKHTIGTNNASRS